MEYPAFKTKIISEISIAIYLIGVVFTIVLAVLFFTEAIQGILNWFDTSVRLLVMVSLWFLHELVTIRCVVEINESTFVVKYSYMFKNWKAEYKLHSIRALGCVIVRNSIISRMASARFNSIRYKKERLFLFLKSKKKEEVFSGLTFLYGNSNIKMFEGVPGKDLDKIYTLLKGKMENSQINSDQMSG